jgi:hypothetical protein
MTQPQELTAELTILDPQRVALRVDAFEDLILALDDGEPQPITATRCFPITHPTHWIALRTKDGSEIGVVADASELDAASQQALEDEFQRTYVLPKVTRIHDILDRHGVPAWEVETDRGPRTIEIFSSKRDIRMLDDHHVLIRDADGNHYEIPDSRDLDPASRDLLETQI